MTVADKQTVTELARAAMEKLEQPNPNAVAELVVQDLAADELRYYAIRGLANHVRNIFRDDRQGSGLGGSGGRSARWENVAKLRTELDLTRVSVWTGDNHKWLLDCTPADLESAADQHMAQAAGHEKSAEILGKLATTLRRAKASVVGDVSEDTVRRIFDA